MTPKASTNTAVARDVPEDVFKAAVELVQNMPKDGDVALSHSDKLEFYALFKQATLGACTTSSPFSWNLVEKYKWDAWKALGSLDSRLAKNRYVDKLQCVMENVLQERSLDALLSDPRWLPIRPIVEPRFSAINNFYASAAGSQTSEPCSSAVTQENEDVRSTFESVYTDIVSSSAVAANTLSEDEYMDARAESPIVVEKQDSPMTSSDYSVPNITYDMLGSLQAVTKLFAKQVQAMSAAFQQQNQAIQLYLAKMSEHRPLTWPLLIFLFIWPIIVQLAIRYLFR